MRANEFVAKHTYQVGDFKQDVFENIAAFRRWMRSPKSNDRGMTRHSVDIYENMLITDTRLLENNQEFAKRKQQAQVFSTRFKQLDQRDHVQIRVGNAISVISATIVPGDAVSRIELSGFVSPKKITKINKDHSDKIDSLEFSDGSRFPEAAEFTTVGGTNITNTIFFSDSAAASKAYTAIWMYISTLEGQGWELEQYLSETAGRPRLDPKCWTGKHAEGTKIKGGVRVNNCVPNESVEEGWSQKYKKSINCAHPKGFSQRAHCAGKRKNNESVDADVMEMVCEDCGMCEAHADTHVNENLRDWFKDKWVRFGPDGKIRGDCARGSESEGKPKCLPQSKAHALGKKGRASAAARKRRQDPNANRSGPAINVSTKGTKK